MSRDVNILEVAPRDGFQSIYEPLPTETKIGIIEKLIAAGFRRIEIGSFVSPRAVPQMADMGEIAAHFRHREGLRLSALVPNGKGAQLALEHGMNDVVFVASVSETHNQKNVQKTFEQSLAQLSDIVAMGDTFRLRVALATAFDCPFEGVVSLDSVRAAVERVLQLAPGAEIALCDTTGRANPYQVRKHFAAMMDEFGAGPGWAFHGHDTFGMGVANALFAYEAGVRNFDVSASGLGGCPFAPGATGNTASEDLVFAFEEGGIFTGIDLSRLLEVSDEIAVLPGACVGGHLRVVPRMRAVTSKGAA